MEAQGWVACPRSQCISLSHGGLDPSPALPPLRPWCPELLHLPRPPILWLVLYPAALTPPVYGSCAVSEIDAAPVCRASNIWCDVSQSVCSVATANETAETAGRDSRWAGVGFRRCFPDQLQSSLQSAVSVEGMA